MVERTLKIENICFGVFARTLYQSTAELLFDEMQIRGAFDGDKFLGYDYDQQEWIEIFKP